MADQEKEPVKKKRGGYRPGAGRRGKGFERRNLTLSLSPEHWRQIDRLMERSGAELAALIREMVTAVVVGMDEAGRVDHVVCPVCLGAGEIQPKGRPEICPGCNGAKVLQQIRLD